MRVASWVLLTSDLSKNCPRTCVPWRLGTQDAPWTQLQPNWMIPPEVSSLVPGETLGSPKGIYCAKCRVLGQGSGLQAVPRHREKREALSHSLTAS